MLVEEVFKDPFLRLSAVVVKCNPDLLQLGSWFSGGVVV